MNKKLLQEIKNTLLKEWDPIGVKGVAAASDEYDSYALQLFGLLNRGASRQALIEYLLKVESEELELGGDSAVAEKVVDKLLLLFSRE